MSFAQDYTAPEKQRVAAALAAARGAKASRREKRHCVVLGFWGFAPSEVASAFVASVCEAFRTQRVFCSDVAPGRFEGLVAVLRVQVPALEELCESAKMSAGLLEMGEVAGHACLRCHEHSIHAGFGASLARVEGGSSKRGTHPAAWGPPFDRYVVDLQLRESVLKVTGMPLEANNMIMLHMAQRSAEQSVASLQHRVETLRRERMLVAARADMLHTEHARILFEVQQAYRTGCISAPLMHRILFGM